MSTKKVKLIMPVGPNRGKPVNLSAEEAAEITRVHGVYVSGGSSNASSSSEPNSARVAELEAEIVTLKKRKATSKEAAERIEQLELQVVELEALLETATASDGGATSQTGDNS